MLLQSGNRTTYGINKVACVLLSFFIFSVVGWVSWQWLGTPGPWRLRLLALTTTALSLLLYFCCDQLGVYNRCGTLSKAVWGLVRAYVAFMVLCIPIWIVSPFRPDWWSLGLSYTLTLVALAWVRINRFQSEKKLLESESVLVVGTPENTRKFADTLQQESIRFETAPVLLSPEDVDVEKTRQLMIDRCVAKVVFLSQGIDLSVPRTLADLCGKMGVDFYAPMVVEMEGVHSTYFGLMGDIRMLVYRSTPIPFSVSWQLKKVFDWIGALLLIICTSPFWLLAAIGIKISDPGPVFYRQKRSGLYGKEFGMWKFRSMYTDADKRLDEVKAKFGNDMSGPIFKLENDPRIFKFGSLIRKLSIDELPQLINVLKGDMSLVGPRPLPIYETAAFTKDEHRRRLSVLPGVTGYWQIAGRSNITDFEKLVAMDTYYIDHWSLWMDLKLLLKTVPAVLLSKGAK